MLLVGVILIGNINLCDMIYNQSLYINENDGTVAIATHMNTDSSQLIY